MSELLNWMKNYYVGEEIENPEEIQKKLDQGKDKSKVYLLTAAANTANVMDLIEASSLLHNIKYQSCPMVIGMAADKESAMNLAVKILMECQEKTGTFRVEEYIKNR